MSVEPTEREQYPHLPVLYHEIIHALQPVSPGRYVDATVGAGGHAEGILEESGPEGRLCGLDVDPQALAIASRRLSVFGDRVHLVQASYTTLLQQVHQFGWDTVQGIVIDLGVSSMQIDTPERGFSFLREGPLDMRFNPLQSVSAADLVNHWPEDELADVLWRYGEEPQSRRIARAICLARPLETTTQLAAVIAKAVDRKRDSGKSRPGRIHPATKSFQALRIAVNQELNALEDFLPQAVSALEPGGRLAVISFHSLEDRIVKQFMRRESRDCICPPEQVICTCGHKASIREISRHSITASEEEAKSNIRARSAHLRVAEKLESAGR
jgi:16S rRNA (cytosine1402-N4)-methyltransferase